MDQQTESRPDQDPDYQRSQRTRAQELRAFFFLTLVTAPVLAIATVGGYGFFVWMYQLFTGRLPTA